MTKQTKIIGGIGIAALLLGAIGWALQLSGGLLGGSGMTNIFLWGIMIAMFAFLVGFGAGSQLVATAVILWGSDEAKPMAKMAASCGLACVGAAGVAILADLGAIRNILAMFIGLNLRSPLAWDMISLTVFIILSIIQLIAIARDMSCTKVLAVLAGIAAIVLQVVEGLLFSTQTAHAWWSSPIMPVDFLAVAFVSGSALMVLIAYVQKRPEGVINWLGRLCAWAIAVHLVLAIVDLCLVAFEGTPQSGGVLEAILGNIVLYVCELALPLIAMILLFISTDKKSKKPATESKHALIASILVIIGIFAHRLMLLYPAYNAPSLYLTLSGTDLITGPYPISTGRYLDWDTTFALGTAYMPAGVEWLAILMPIGVAILATFIVLWILDRISGTPAQGASHED